MAITASGAFNKGHAGGPYGHYTLHIPKALQFQLLDWLLSDQVPQAVRARVFTDGVDAFTRVLGFPVCLIDTVEGIQLVPNDQS